MTGVETLAWLVLAFADGSDCLIQGSFHWLPEGRVFTREDGCSVHSQQEGAHVVFWSDSRWVAIKVPSGARSLSYRWGRSVAFVNGNNVHVQHGTILGNLQSSPSGRDRDQERSDPQPGWRIGDAFAYQRTRQCQAGKLTRCSFYLLERADQARPPGTPDYSVARKALLISAFASS